MHPTVRPLDPSDFDTVAELWHQSWHDGHGAIMPPHVVAERSRESFRLRLETLPQESFVAVSDGVPIAFGVLIDNTIDQFYVHRSFRGTGVAKLFLSVLEEKLAAWGVVDGIIECAKGNTRAYRFYAKSGWTETALLDCPIWTADDRLETFPNHCFTKRLGP